MSISGVWTAIRGKDKADVLRELGLELRSQSSIVGTLLSSGWYVITVNLRSAEDPCAPQLARLSTDCEVFTFGAVESTGYQQAAGWNDGTRIWSAIYDPDQSGEVVVEGSAPTIDCNELDVFELSKSLVGFRPDEGCLEPSEPLAPSRAVTTSR